MKLKNLKKYRNIIEQIELPDERYRWYVTLIFPNPDIHPSTADKLIKRLMDSMTKKYKGITVISIMGFGKEKNGIHYHLLILDNEKVSKTEYIDGFFRLKNEFHIGEKISFERNRPVSAIEAWVRKYWRKSCHKYLGEYPNRERSVDFQPFELHSETLLDYLMRYEEKELPREWKNDRVTWLRYWGRKNVVKKLYLVA